MPCTSPRDVWPAPPGAPDRRPVSSPQRSYPGAKSFQLPCGGCIPCRLAKAQDWATRIVHEGKFHEHNWFVTCTYSDQFLPSDGSLSYDHHTNFMRRVRRHAAPAKPRFLGVGEYGDRFGRPHYHYIIHGMPLADVRLTARKDEHKLYTSKIMQDIWGMGYAPVQELTFANAQYVARYTLKKVTGERAEQYFRPHPITGEQFKVIPEFARMSRMPGLGTAWFEKHHRTEFTGDHLIVDGRKKPIPKFYLSKLSATQQAEIAARRNARANTDQQRADNTEARLLTRNKSAGLKAQRLTRDKATGHR